MPPDRLLEEHGMFIPEEQEQFAICSHLYNQMRMIGNRISRVDESATMLREHRMALISAGVTGKIDVRST